MYTEEVRVRLAPRSSYWQCYASFPNKPHVSHNRGPHSIFFPGNVKFIFFFHCNGGRGFFSDNDKISVWERECGRGWSRGKGQDDPGCGWEICKWEVLDHTWPPGTPSRNQKVSRQNFSSVKWKTNGWRRMVLSSSSGGVTFLLKKMMFGNLNLTESEHMICEFQK